jgi:hypothetical protein
MSLLLGGTTPRAVEMFIRRGAIRVSRRDPDSPRPRTSLRLGAAGYRFGDYWRLGIVVMTVFFAVGVFLVPVIWSFQAGHEPGSWDSHNRAWPHAKLADSGHGRA